jgi:hypothetical protein
MKQSVLLFSRMMMMARGTIARGETIELFRERKKHAPL